MLCKSLKSNQKKAFFLPIILVFAALFFAYATALVSYSIANIKSTTISNKKISALSIAEAGVNYYLWHMQHYPDDYCDLVYYADGEVNEVETPLSNCDKLIDAESSLGKKRPELVGYKGPYEHKYSDGRREIGNYKLYIKDPLSTGGNPIVRSEGQLKSGGPIKKIVVEIGTNSLTKYAIFGDGYTGVNDTPTQQTITLTSKEDWQQGENIDTKLDEPAPDGGELMIDIANGKTTATHTTAPTQIYGSETWKIWDLFIPEAYDADSNASIDIKYRFRISEDGSDWTSWTAPWSCTASSPCDLRNIMNQNYLNKPFLQVNATLSTTNTNITPKISSYTIKYTNLTPTYKIMDISSEYHIHGPVHSNGPINFKGIIDSNYTVESAHQGLVETGPLIHNPNDPDYQECKSEIITFPLLPNKYVFKCPAVWGAGVPPENRKFPVASIDAGTVINDKYFDELKEKALEDGAPYYFDMNNRPGECSKQIYMSYGLGVYFFEDRIAFYPIWDSLSSDKRTFSRYACFDIKTTELESDSKHKIIYFDNTRKIYLHGAVNEMPGNTITILGGKWNSKVSLVSDTWINIKAMNLEYTSPQAKIGIMARTNFVTQIDNARQTFEGPIYNCGIPQYASVCKYLPYMKDGDFASLNDLLESQTWSASFISQLKSIYSINHGPNRYNKLTLKGSNISLYSMLLLQADGQSNSRYNEIHYEPDLGHSPPGFPYLKDVSIISWREE